MVPSDLTSSLVVWTTTALIACTVFIYLLFRWPTKSKESIETTTPIAFQSPAPKSGRMIATWDIGVVDPSMLVSALKERSFLRADEMYDIINRFQGEKVTLKMDNPGTIPKAFKKMYDEGTLEDDSMSSSGANQTSVDFLCQIGIDRNDPKLCYYMTEFTGKLTEDIRGIGAAMESDLRKVGINDTYDLFALARRVDNTEEFMDAIDPRRKFRRNAITVFHCVAELLDFAATEIYGLDLTSSELRPWVDPVGIAAEKKVKKAADEKAAAEKKAADEKAAAEKKAADDRWWKEGDIVEFNNDINVLISINEKKLQVEKSYKEKYWPRGTVMDYTCSDARLKKLQKIKSANPTKPMNQAGWVMNCQNKQYIVEKVTRVDSKIFGQEETHYVGQAKYNLKAVDSCDMHTVDCTHHELTAPFNKDPGIENTILTSPRQAEVPYSLHRLTKFHRHAGTYMQTQWATVEEAYKAHGDKLKTK